MTQQAKDYLRDYVATSRYQSPAYRRVIYATLAAVVEVLTVVGFLFHPGLARLRWQWVAFRLHRGLRLLPLP